MRGLELRSGQGSWRSILALLRFVRLERKVLNKGELKARLPAEQSVGLRWLRP